MCEGVDVFAIDSGVPSLRQEVPETSDHRHHDGHGVLPRNQSATCQLSSRLPSQTNFLVW